MPNMTGPVSQPGFSSSATPLHALGAYRETPDGRGYRYAGAGGSALVAGNVLQHAVEDGDHDDLAVAAAAAVGATQVTITTGSGNGALTVNEYAWGFLCVSDEDGEGYTYRIKSHPVIAASSDGVITLMDEDALVEALTTSSKVTLQQHPYDNVIQAPITTATGAPVGVAIYDIAGDEYGWIQTHGACNTLIDGTPQVGNLVTSEASAAGRAAIHSGTLPIIGHMMETGRDGEHCPVFLTID